LTDPSNTCKRHVITLSGNYTIEDLIQEAGNHYSYDPFSFSLMWKSQGQMINISDIQTSNLSLTDLGLQSNGKNMFEIHEKEEGPPKKLKQTVVEEEGSMASNDMMPSLEENTAVINSYPTRRNAVYSSINNVIETGTQAEFGPVNLPTLSAFNFDDNNEYVGLINQAMTCYLNSLIQTLYMTPEFRNGIYRFLLIQLLKHYLLKINKTIFAIAFGINIKIKLIFI
jgi:hypothetical protein